MEVHMQAVKNERGYVLIFVTVMIVLLLVMVGMGLDTGHLAYVRSQGQPAVDAAALAAASAIPTGDLMTVKTQATKFDPSASGNPSPTGNNYVSSPSNAITSSNVTIVHYEPTTGVITTANNVDPTAPQNVRANGARVALENNNPYGGTVGAAMKSPLFLTPLFNLLGYTTSGTADVTVSAVAVIRALPGMPIAVAQSTCGSTTTLDFQSGGKSNSGWETYYIANASTSEIRALWDNLPYCSGQPIVDVGFCGNLANGVNDTIFNQNIKKMFKDKPDRCYLVPVVANNGNMNQCQKIIDWAQFCPDLDLNKAMPGPGKLYGTVTCGQSTWTSRDTKCYVPLLVRDAKSGM
jgi:Flp pilus assembly protein TadG